MTLFGCVNIKSGEVTSKTADKGNYKSFKKYLKKVLRKYTGKKVIMILDNVRYHHAKLLKTFLQKNEHRIELMYLPPYSPDLNCMERIWWYMRKKITHNMFVDTIEDRKIKYWKLFSTFEKENEICKNLINLCANY